MHRIANPRWLRWWIVAPLLLAVVADHAIAFYRLWAHVALPALATIGALLLLQHVGLFGSLAVFRRRR